MMKSKRAVISTLFVSVLSAMAMTSHAASSSYAGNGIIIDGINFALGGTAPVGPDGNQTTTPVMYTNIFKTPNVPATASWMIDCATNNYASCTSAFTQDLKNATGNNITYLLLDFPSIDMDYTDPTGKSSPFSTINTCPISDGVPKKFTPEAFNYVAPFKGYSDYLGIYVNVCEDGQKSTQAFAQNGHKVIPMISGDGSALLLPADKSTTHDADVTAYLQAMAGLIATEINNDTNASGVAFDLEPSLKGVSQNQAFFGTLATALSPQNKIIMIYNGDWESLSQVPNIDNIIAMGPLYDFGAEDSDAQNHWFQDISPASYGFQFTSQFKAFLNGYAKTLNKMIVVPSAASDTMWTGLDIIHNEDKEPLNSLGVPTNYDPYSQGPGDIDKEPSVYTPKNPIMDLASAAPIKCPNWSDTQLNPANCYGSPYPSQQGSDQNSYIKQTLSSETTSAIQNGTLQGVIFYNIKPDNFYELNCDNTTNYDLLCLSFQPESTPSTVIQDLNTFESNLKSGVKSPFH